MAPPDILTDYIPQKQGLRLIFHTEVTIASALTDYIPQKQGLRQEKLIDFHGVPFFSQTIFHKNKD